MPRPVPAPDPERQLMIKTKTCQRLLKEVNYYQKEVQENEVKLQQMKDDNRDPYDVKKFAEVLDESYMMVPDSEARLAQAVHELRDFLEEETSKLDPRGEWFTTAESLLKENGASGKGPSVDAIVPETKVEDLAEGEAF